VGLLKGCVGCNEKPRFNFSILGALSQQSSEAIFQEEVNARKSDNDPYFR
jgi:hypothetical protein